MIIETPESFAKNLMQRFNSLGYGQVICKLLCKNELRDFEIVLMQYLKSDSEDFYKLIQFLKETEKVIDSIQAP